MRDPAANQLGGHAVVVTDACTDAGEAHARALAATGAGVVLCGRDGARLGTLAAELSAEGTRVSVFADDPASDDGAAALVEMVTELFGPRNP